MPENEGFHIFGLEDKKMKQIVEYDIVRVNYSTKIFIFVVNDPLHLHASLNTKIAFDETSEC